MKKENKKKTCTKCKKKKSKDKFYKKKNGKCNSWCKDCVRKSNLRRYHNGGSSKKEKKEKKINYYPNSYIKVERVKHNDFYYRKPKHCYCQKLSDRICSFCSIKEVKIIKHLKKIGENFWDENHLSGLRGPEFRGMKKDGHEVKTIL